MQKNATTNALSQQQIDTDDGEARRRALFAQVQERFVSLVRDLPFVQGVVLEASEPDDGRIWTVIDAPPFDFSYSQPVYAAQREALELLDEPVVEFAMLNVAELEGDIGDVLPPG